MIAFDARTGRRVWTFHTIPQQGEFGNETWGDASWRFTGHTNVWAPMTLDDSRGLVYLPVSTPSNDFYGAARPGQAERRRASAPIGAADHPGAHEGALETWRREERPKPIFFHFGLRLGLERGG